MAYTVYNNNGTVLVNIANGDVDDLATSLDLVGKNVNNYGELINNNFVRLLTNFSNATGPRSPQQGQLWFDSQNNNLKVYNGSAWSSLLNASVQATSPTNQRSGELWFDSNNKQFKVYANGTWTVVGPNVNPDLGKFGVEPTPPAYHVREYSTNDNKNCSIVYSYGRPMMILSTYTFAASNATSLYYYGLNTATVIYSGTNIISTLSVHKDLLVSGSLQVSGGIVQTPDKTLTASYNSGWVGAFTSEYTATNTIVRLEVLPYLFSTATNTWTNATALDSEVKVLLTSGTFTATEVRHYRLEERVPGVRVWEAYEIYPAVGTAYSSVVSTWTNVVRIT